jgi:mannose-6-phosphate isomerase-like protein (cupin superfamily)
MSMLASCRQADRPAVEASNAVPASSQVAPAWPESMDAVVAAPDNHKVVLENDDVRVLDVTVQPGEREKVHGHKWRSVLYVISEGEIKDYDANGNVIYDTKTDPNPMKAPYTIWMDPQEPHAVENFSKEPLRLIRVELKK